MNYRGFNAIIEVRPNEYPKYRYRAYSQEHSFTLQGNDVGHIERQFRLMIDHFLQ